MKHVWLLPQAKEDANELEMQRAVSTRTPQGQAVLLEQRRLHPTRVFYPGQLYEPEVLPCTCPGLTTLLALWQFQHAVRARP